MRGIQGGQFSSAALEICQCSKILNAFKRCYGFPFHGDFLRLGNLIRRKGVILVCIKFILDILPEAFIREVCFVNHHIVGGKGGGGQQRQHHAAEQQDAEKSFSHGLVPPFSL